MPIGKIASPVDVAVSGLRAESLRMNVIANNIANSNTTRTPAGEPYRRKEVVLSTNPGELSGVSIDQVSADSSDFKTVFDPGDPYANAEGYVQMPNVELPLEMMNMITASRSYQANAAVLKRYQEMVDVALDTVKS